MSKMYVIQWKSKINGRAGKGTKQFESEEADRLVRELNQEYPQIHHEAVSVAPQSELSQSQPHESAAASQPETEEEHPSTTPPHAFSID